MELSKKKHTFVPMIELLRHIEVLMLENDCVIVPGFGGFIANYSHAATAADVFTPPTRTIGFNPRLTINDGLLAQSYMTVFNATFPDANKRIAKDVEQLVSLLHDEGKVEIHNVGELRYSIYGMYDFMPYDDKLLTPACYGLDSFEMPVLPAEQPKPVQVAVREKPATMVALQPLQPKEEVRETSLGLNIAAMIAVIFMSILFSIPVKQTQLTTKSFARLVPTDFLEDVRNSINISSIHTTHDKASVDADDTKQVNDTQHEQAEEAAPVVQQPVQQQVAAKKYHIIVASVGTERDANHMASQLVKSGHEGAKAIIADGKNRVSIASCATEADAYTTIHRMQAEGIVGDAWVLRR